MHGIGLENIHTVKADPALFEKCYADQMQLNYILICTVLVKWTRQIFKSFCSFRVVISGLKITCHKLQYVFI